MKRLLLSLICCSPLLFSPSVSLSVNLIGPGGEIEAQAEQYGPVRDVETLWAISSKLRPNTSVSVQQTMVAIYKINPFAFYDGNINKIISESVLTVPSLEFVSQQTDSEAIALIRKYSIRKATPSKTSSTAKTETSSEKIVETTAVKKAAPRVEKADPAITAQNEANKQKLLSTENELDALKAEMLLLNEQYIIATESTQVLKLKLQPLNDTVAMLTEQVESEILIQETLQNTIDEYRAQLDAIEPLPYSGDGLFNEILRFITASVTNILIVIISPLLLLLLLVALIARIRSKRLLAEQEQELAESTTTLMEESGQFDELLTEDFSNDENQTLDLNTEKSIIDTADIDLTENLTIPDGPEPIDLTVADDDDPFGIGVLTKDDALISSVDLDDSELENSPEDPFGIGALTADETFNSSVDLDEVTEISDADQADLDLAAQWEAQVSVEAEQSVKIDDAIDKNKSSLDLAMASTAINSDEKVKSSKGNVEFDFSEQQQTLLDLGIDIDSVEQSILQGSVLPEPIVQVDSPTDFDINRLHSETSNELDQYPTDNTEQETAIADFDIDSIITEKSNEHSSDLSVSATDINEIQEIEQPKKTGGFDFSEQQKTLLDLGIDIEGVEQSILKGDMGDEATNSEVLIDDFDIDDLSSEELNKAVLEEPETFEQQTASVEFDIDALNVEELHNQDLQDADITEQQPESVDFDIDTLNVEESDKSVKETGNIAEELDNSVDFDVDSLNIKEPDMPVIDTEDVAVSLDNSVDFDIDSLNLENLNKPIIEKEDTAEPLDNTVDFDIDDLNLKDSSKSVLETEETAESLDNTVDFDTDNLLVEESNQAVDMAASEESSLGLDIEALELTNHERIFDELNTLSTEKPIEHENVLYEAELENLEELIEQDTVSDQEDVFSQADIDNLGALIEHDLEKVDATLESVDITDDSIDFSLLELGEDLSDLDNLQDELLQNLSQNDVIEKQVDIDDVDDISKPSSNEISANEELDSLAKQLSDVAFNEEVPLPKIDDNDDNSFIDIETLLGNSDLPSGEEPYSELDLDLGLEDFPDVVNLQESVDIDDDENGIGAHLDLARAYLEIDDKAGAKEILMAVVEGSNGKQRKEIDKLLSRLN